MSAGHADYDVDAGDDYWLLEIDQSFWSVVGHHWPKVQSAQLQWRRARKRFSATVATWDRKSGDDTPEDMVRQFYQERVSAVEAASGDDLEWRVRLFSSDGEHLGDAAWASLLDPKAAGEFSLMTIVASQASLIVKQHQIVDQLMSSSSALVLKTTEAFDRAMTWQSQLVEYVTDYRADVAKAEARRDTVDRLITFVEDHPSFVRDTLGDVFRDRPDEKILSDLPPDLVPFAVLVLSRDRAQIERFLNVMPEDVYKDFRMRLQASEGGRKILEVLAELFKGSASKDDATGGARTS